MKLFQPALSALLPTLLATLPTLTGGGVETPADAEVWAVGS